MFYKLDERLFYWYAKLVYHIY